MKALLCFVFLLISQFVYSQASDYNEARKAVQKAFDIPKDTEGQQPETLVFMYFPKTKIIETVFASDDILMTQNNEQLLYALQNINLPEDKSFVFTIYIKYPAPKCSKGKQSKTFNESTRETSNVVFLKPVVVTTTCVVIRKEQKLGYITQ